MHKAIEAPEATERKMPEAIRTPEAIQALRGHIDRAEGVKNVPRLFKRSVATWIAPREPKNAPRLFIAWGAIGFVQGGGGGGVVEGVKKYPRGDRLPNRPRRP